MSFTHKRIVSSLLCLTSMAVVSAFGAYASHASGIGMTANHSMTIGLLATVEQAATPAGAVQDPKKPQPPQPPAANPAATPTGVAAPQPPTPVDPNAPIMVKPEPPEVDLGDIPTMDSKTANLKLVNTDDKPRTVKSVRPSCGCTTLKFVPDTVIPAGESIEIQVQMSGGMMPGPLLHKTVTVTVEGQPDVIVPLKAQAVSFVVVDPMTLDPQVQKDGTFKLKSTDSQAFRIMSIQPPVIDGFPDESKVEHDLTLNWDKFNEASGNNRRLTFYLDHPKCQQTFAIINMPPAPPRPGEPTPPVQPVAPQPTVDPIEQLVKDGKNSEVLEKIKGGLDVNRKDQSGMSIISMAAKYGNIDLISALIAAGANKEATDNVGRTPLMFAAQSKNPAAIRALIAAGASVTARDQIGGTALSWASGLGDAASVQELLDAGSDVEVVGLVTGWTPLIWAAGFGDPASIPILVKYHANLEAGDILQGATPLICAARTGRVEGIKALIKAGAKLEAMDKTGKTALLAVSDTSGGTAEKLQALIEAGANIHAKDNRKYNALQLARKRTDVRAPDVIKVLEPLLAAETPPDEPAKAEVPAAAGNAVPAATATPAAQPNGASDSADHGGHGN